MSTNKHKKKYLSLSEASELTPYSAEYLSLLARRGKLFSVKKGRLWVTTKEGVREYLATAPTRKRDSEHADKHPQGDLISLAEAAKLTKEYSSAYLKLRVNQGKLAGKKIGRNWYTTLEWVQEYLREYGEKQRDAPSESLRRGGLRLPFTHALATRTLAAALTLTMAFLFVAPPRVWAHWGESAARVAGNALDATIRESVRVTRKLAATTGIPALDRLAAGLSELRIPEQVQVRLSEGVVAGDAAIRSLSPERFSFTDALSHALTLPSGTLKPSVTFLNPNELAASLPALSRTTHTLTANLGTLLQGANQYVARITSGGQATPSQSPPWQGGEGSVPLLTKEGLGVVPFGPSRLGTSSQGTLMVGSLPLQAASTTFTNQADPSQTALQIVSTGSGAILQGISSNGDVVFQVSDAGILKVGAASTVIDTSSVTTGTVRAVSVATANLTVSGLASFSSLLTAKDASITNTLTAGGPATFNDTLSVAKDIHALAGLLVDAAITANSLTVAGPTTLNGPTTINAPLRVNDTLTAKNANITGSLTVS
ncbi:hypothetical protein HYW68_00830, partial [Candidatus Parcubacteria bacterium]|nr:hypothetical protein [Candidatus Parcubacteria bacterium]